MDEASCDSKTRKEEEGEECPECGGKGCDHCDGKGYHKEKEVMTPRGFRPVEGTGKKMKESQSLVQHSPKKNEMKESALIL